MFRYSLGVGGLPHVLHFLAARFMRSCEQAYQVQSMYADYCKVIGVIARGVAVRSIHYCSNSSLLGCGFGKKRCP